MQLQKQDYLFVLIQFVLFVLFLLDTPSLGIYLPRWLQSIGIPFTIIGVLICGIAILQLNTKISPFPTPKSGSALIQNGIFSRVRHPIYSGILLALSGLSLHYQSGYKMGIIILLFTLFYFKTTYEEKRLEVVFEEYGDYKARTKRFVPYLF